MMTTDVLEAADEANASLEEAMTDGSDESSGASATAYSPSWTGIAALAAPWLAAALLAMATADRPSTAPAVGAAPPAANLHAVRAIGPAGATNQFEAAVPSAVGGESDTFAETAPNG